MVHLLNPALVLKVKGIECLGIGINGRLDIGLHGRFEIGFRKRFETEGRGPLT